MTTLLEVVTSLSDADRNHLSRLYVATAPGCATVTLHIAGLIDAGEMGVHDDGVRSIPRSPVSTSDIRGVADRNPPVRLRMLVSRPEPAYPIAVDSLIDQIQSLDRSGLLGNLNVERLGRGIVISTSAGSQDERDAWLRAKVFGRPRPPAPAAPQSIYVTISGDTYPQRNLINRIAARDGGFARWDRGRNCWRAKLIGSSIAQLRDRGLIVESVEPAGET